MPKAEMVRYAWALTGSKRKYNQVLSNPHGMKALVNNIYTLGDYSFIDYSLQNTTKIAYDSEELRVKLTDKKETKATNSQTIELTPVYSLNPVKKFKKNYRNVLVIEKLTFPDEKVLRLEFSENQISGRVIALTIEYETKATNSQTIELTPVYSLNPVKKFKKNYRNVLVIEKLTFPDEKVLRLEISENQISGRVIALTIEYEDILNADGFDSDILKNSSCYPYYYIYR